MNPRPPFNSTFSPIGNLERDQSVAELGDVVTNPQSPARNQMARGPQHHDVALVSIAMLTGIIGAIPLSAATREGSINSASERAEGYQSSQRRDKVSYLRAAYATTNFAEHGVISSEHALLLDSDDEVVSGSIIKAIVHEDYPWLDESAEDLQFATDQNIDNPIQCELYLAESSIPNAGLGIYTAVDLDGGMKPFGNPDIGIALFDISLHTDDGFSSKFSSSAVSSYHWEGWVLEMGQFAALEVLSIIPGPGAAANTHPGLNNVRIVEGTPKVHRGAMDRSRDHGAGAISEHYGARFGTEKQDIPMGSELFVDYGESWVEARENTIGIIPRKYNYDDADRIINDFLAGPPDQRTEDKWAEILRDTAGKDKRTNAALPDSFNELEHASRLGSAVFSTPNAIRSIAWLKQNGICMDNIRVGTSTIPQAGRGAFATRSIKEGDLVAPLPVMQLDRNLLNIFGPDGSVKGRQLLLNYCFGHWNSPILLFPYSSTVHFINHGGDSSNAMIRWSSSIHQRGDLLKQSAEYVKNHKSGGLLLEIVATQDISLGEEILIDYGRFWEKAWSEHVDQWTPVNSHTFVDPAEYNEDGASIVRTVLEQEESAYPNSIRTACYYQYFLTDSKAADSLEKKSADGTILWTFDSSTMLNRFLRPCDILKRDKVGDSDWYTVRMHNFHDIPNVAKMPENETERVVKRVPRWAIRFVERDYANNEHLLNAFRQEIGIDDTIFPTSWLNDIK